MCSLGFKAQTLSRPVIGQLRLSTNYKGTITASSIITGIKISTKKMILKQGLLLWSPCRFLSPTSLPSRSLPISTTTKHNPKLKPITATLGSSKDTTTTTTKQLTARERRQLRNERRESNAYNWKEEVEEMLMKKPKKTYTPKSAQLNLDNLALLGPQWWIVRVSRVRGHETANLIARQLARNFPEMEFKVYAPAIQVKRKLKNGTYSVKPKPIFPGCVFLRCVMNREIHDFLREVEGVGGFVGAKVGTNKRQINKPRPVSDDDMETVFQEAKEEQENYKQAFKEEQAKEEQGEGGLNFDELRIYTQSEPNNVTVSVMEPKPKKESRKSSDSLANGPSAQNNDKVFVPGSTIRVVSGTFAEFVGSLKKVNRKTRKATVRFTLFGKESFVELDLNEIVVETN